MPVQEWFAQWMNKHEAICFKEAEHTDLASLFWLFRWSYTQRCFLRSLQSKTSAVIAGSYGTAWHFHRSGKQTWLPNDIDVWLFEHEAFEWATRTLYEHAAMFETHLARRGSDLHNLDELQIEEYECETIPEILSARKEN